ncbi:hypothetical protein AMV100 [Betaentomopoxvirus amoorei]|uniref:AMV100 n=1 Tax=Amsacta moorei entomopoxvirus TaxID=28321 RepID=Q9EMU9_AMEPV|nr:hypothetical protein AMV100 [Amsacta moorei entomopoxvirus]AAG02806.1 AMV100 [Amsacta moorei entomopoxvirus]
MSSIIYDEKIKNTFYSAHINSYQLVIDKKTGFFNASYVCIKNYRKINNWLNNKKTIKLIKYYMNLLNNKNNNNNKIKYKIVDKYDNINGIYLHPILLNHLLDWINIKINNKYNIIDYIILVLNNIKLSIYKNNRNY